MTLFVLLVVFAALTEAKDGGHQGVHQQPGHHGGQHYGGHHHHHGGHNGGHVGGHHSSIHGIHDGFHHDGHHGGGHAAVHIEEHHGHHGHHGHHEHQGHHHYDDHYEPPHYSYGYNVYGGTPYEARFDKSETRTEGLTTGGYSVDLPDGRTQVVTYTVAGPAGFQAKVEYFPTASYHAHPH